MSFPWMRKSVMWLAGGMPPRVKIEKTEPALTEPVLLDGLVVADKIWYKVRKEIASLNKDAVIIHIPEEDEQVIYACTDMHSGRWRDLRFDRNTIELLPNSQKAVREAKAAEWISRSNYALHTGFIGGMWTKVLYFMASLICASLPITGFYVWWGKKKKTKKKHSPRKSKATAELI